MNYPAESIWYPLHELSQYKEPPPEVNKFTYTKNISVAGLLLLSMIVSLFYSLSTYFAMVHSSSTNAPSFEYENNRQRLILGVQELENMEKSGEHYTNC